MAKKGFSRLPAEDWRTPDMAATLEGEAGARLFGVSPDLPKIVEIDLDNIDSNPHQPRKSFDQEKLDSLAANIEKHGLKYPILVSRNDGRFRLVGGERRYRAHRQLGRTTIAAIIVDGDTDEVGLIDNLQRVDLNALEMATAFERLMSRHGYTQEQLGQTVGRSKAEVSNILGLRRLADQIRSEYPDFTAVVGARTLCEIAREKDIDKQLALWARAKDGEGCSGGSQGRIAAQTHQSADGRIARPPPGVDGSASRSSPVAAESDRRLARGLRFTRENSGDAGKAALM